MLDGYQGILNKETGIITVPVFHERKTQASDEEVYQIVLLSSQLIGRIFTAKDSTEHIIGWDDILFVALYNHQVNKLKLALGEQAKVGSVNKFQGQEAPIVVYSPTLLDTAVGNPKQMVMINLLCQLTCDSII